MHPCCLCRKPGFASSGQGLITPLTLNVRAAPAPRSGTYGTSSVYSPLFPLFVQVQINMLPVNIHSALWHCIPMTGVKIETFFIVLFYILILQFILFSICHVMGTKIKPRIFNFLYQVSFLCFPYNFRLIAILQNLPIYSLHTI